MDEYSGVLEPLDTNSMCLGGIGSVGSPSVSIKKENTPFEFRGENIETSHVHTPLKWRTQRDEFVFNSNSTPIGNEYEGNGNSGANKSYFGSHLGHRGRKSGLGHGHGHGPGQGHRRRLKFSMAGAGPHAAKSYPSLQSQVSKLDLLDNDKLTSFPIVPPREPVSSKNQKHPTNEYQMKIHSTERRISLNPTVTDTLDPSFDQNELFLIEDYIPRDVGTGSSEDGRMSCKRVSISDLKSKYYKRKQLDALPLRLKKSKAHLPNVSESHCEDINVLGNIMQPSLHMHQEQDQYLNEMVLASNLKHCVICEKPLYELSSHLHETGREYQEIVCLGCTSKYEEAARLLEDYEFETTLDETFDTGNTDSMDSIDFREQPEVLVNNIPRSEKADQFSSQLINTLQLVQRNTESTLSSSKTSLKSVRPFVDISTKIWYHEAKRKLRWRWRVSGLLPKFLTESFKSTHSKTSSS